MSDDRKFTNADLLRANGVYLTGEDNLRLTTFGALASLVVNVEGRIVSGEGCIEPFSEQQIPNSDRTAKVSIFPLREGLLTNVQLRVGTGIAFEGAVAAIVELVRGREGGVQPLATLLQGYVTSGTRLAWPGSPITSLVGGPQRARAILGTNPAPGAEILETVPPNARWKLRSFRFVFVASVAVANRQPVLTIDDGANILWEASSAVVVTASQTATYAAGVGVPFSTPGTRSYHLPLPGELVLPAGSRIRTVTALLDVADDYAAPIYTVDESIEE